MSYGIVLSDLHLFSRRSEGEKKLGEIKPVLNGAEVLILNGDIFDFRWSTLRPENAAIDAATRTVEQLAGESRCRELHYVLGNHDCIPEFVHRLQEISGVQCHTHSFRIGTNLFLHGDSSNRVMNENAFARYREKWEQDKPRPDWAGRCYEASDRLRVSHLFHQLYFPRNIAVTRIARHLDHIQPGWRDETEDCFFGHTHRAFRDCDHEGIRFHNTGCALRGMEFLPLTFSL